MKNTKSWLMLVAFFVAISQASAFDLTVGRWKIEVNETTGKANFYTNGDLLIANTSGSFKNGDTTYSQEELSNLIITQTALDDEFGQGVCVTLASNTADGVSVVHNYYLYDANDYFLTDLTISAPGLESNYMAPIEFSGAVPILGTSGNRVQTIPFDNDAFIAYGSFAYSSNNTNTKRTSYEVGVLYNESSRNGVIMGSVEHTTWKTGVVTYTRQNAVTSMEVYGGISDSQTRDNIPHGKVKGSTVKSPKILVGYFSDWREGMEIYADVNAIIAPKAKWNGKKPFGWNSWGVIKDALNYTNATESANWINDNLYVNGFNNEGEPLYIGLDSFWDWDMTTNQLMRIPHEWKVRNNQVAGMYGGPYTDWSDGNDDNDVLDTGYKYRDIYLRANGQKQKLDGAYALDPTHPGTKAIAESQIDRFLLWGYRYIKIDFMSHASMQGDSYYDSNITTGIQAYNYALQHITSYIESHPLRPKNEQVFLNLSIAPLFPANYTQSRRISCDAWESLEDTKYVLNSLTFGWWLDRVYSYNDADHVVIGSNNGLAKARIASSLITGIFILGNDFSSSVSSTIKDRAKNLLTNPEINRIASQCKAFRPVTTPTSTTTKGGIIGACSAAPLFIQTKADTTYLALFNYGSSSSNVSINFNLVDLTPGTTYVVKELWSGTTNERTATWSESVSTSDRCKILKIYPKEPTGNVYPEPEPEPDPEEPYVEPTPTAALNPTGNTFGNWQVIKNTSNGLPSTTSGRMIWGDYNNDGFLDAFLIAGGNGGASTLYKNNGDDTFTTMPSFAMDLNRSSAVFVDYNNDGNLDIVTVGNLSNGQGTVIVYQNSGAPNYIFSVDAACSTTLIAGRAGNNDSAGRMLEAVDFDHDGWMDLIETADLHDSRLNNNGWRLTAYYKNNQGRFERQTTLVGGANFTQLASGSIHSGDVNGDGYADIVVIGWGDNGINWQSRLYMNNGDGTFTQSPYSSSLSKNEHCETVLVDVNGDGYADIVEVNSSNANIHAYNPTTGSFTKHTNTGLLQSNCVSISAGDIDNDGDNDLIMQLMSVSGNIKTKIFYNNGNLKFTAVDVPAGTDARSGSVSLVDINRDGKLDFSNFGWGSAAYTACFVKNIIESTNVAPSIPQWFTVSYTSGKYVLTWTKSTDDITPQAALRYNVYAKEENTGKTYFYAPADIATGKLKIGGGIVPLITTNSFEWKLPEGEYVFGVQAVDQADMSSVFAIATIHDVVEVVTLSPADGATNVEPDAAITVEFSMMIAGSLDNIMINDMEATASIEDNILTIIHDGLALDTEYTVTIPAAAIDDYSEDIIWSFTTKQGTGIDNSTTVGNVYIVDQRLYVTGYSANASVAVYNILGQVVAYNWKATDGIHLPLGAYIVKVQEQDKEYTHKVLSNK